MSAFSYDITQYESHPYAQTHPELMFTIGRLFGLHPKPFESCRVLELGCAAGGNIIPMAYNAPKSQFVGIDLSAKQIEVGLSQIQDLGLSNIQLLHKSIDQIDERDGKFDYIICHGVLSWVPENIQNKIFEICRSLLYPQGIAYISYNTFPGWNMVKSIREMMLYHTSTFDSHQKKTEQARSLLAFLVESLEGQDTPYANFLRSELTLLSNHGDHYLLHDHLENDNKPFYFHEFMQKATDAGLSYLSDTQLSLMYPNNLPEKVSNQITKITDIIRTNQYMDFIRNQRFRCTLLCQKEAVVNRNLKHEDVEQFCFNYTGIRRETIEEKEMAEGEIFQLQGHGMTLTLKTRLSKIAMRILHDARKPISYDKLLKKTVEESGINNISLVKQAINYDLNLMRLLLAGLVSIHSTEGAYTLKKINKPRVSKMARYQANHKPIVTNQRHEIIGLNIIEKQLIQYLDGTNSIGDIFQKMNECFTKGELNLLREDGIKITDTKEIARRTKHICEELINKFAENALLITE